MSAALNAQVQELERIVRGLQSEVGEQTRAALAETMDQALRDIKRISEHENKRLRNHHTQRRDQEFRRGLDTELERVRTRLTGLTEAFSNFSKRLDRLEQQVNPGAVKYKAREFAGPGQIRVVDAAS